MLKLNVIIAILIVLIFSPGPAGASEITVTMSAQSLEVMVPDTWSHVNLEVPGVSPEEWQRVVRQGTTVYLLTLSPEHPLTGKGRVSATLCDNNSCRLIEEEFTIPKRPPPFRILLACAFTAGLLMLFMPCTLPALGLKLAAYKGGSDVAYVAGVILSFTLLGLAAALLGTGLSQMTSWWYRAALMVVCYTVGLQFLGWLKVPVFGTQARNPFVLGVLSVALGSSCTVPFVAPILIATSILPAWQTVLLFQVVGVGFVTPFILPIHGLLPKPGVWMLRFEQACGIAMLVVAGWMLTTLHHVGSEQVSYPTEGPRAIIVTGDFCLNCKVVRTYWEQPAIKAELDAQGIDLVVLDWTDGNKEVTDLLDQYGVKAIPFALIVNSEGRETVLTGIYTPGQIIQALH